MNNNNNKRSSSLKQLKTLQTQIPIQQTPILRSLEQLKTEGIQYYYHQGNERKQLHKIFTLNTKKRGIQRYINQCLYKAEINGISLKASQLDRFNLYQKDLKNELLVNSQSYHGLKKGENHTNSSEQLLSNKFSQHREIRIQSGQRIPSQQENFQSFQTRIHKIKPTREQQLVEAIKKDNLFTIVYKSNMFSNN